MDSSAPLSASPPENAQRLTVSSFFKIGRVLVILVSYAFIFLGFLCQIGGVGKANKDCGENCKDAFRYYWWTTSFQVLVVLGVAATLVTNTLKEVSMGVSILMAVSITQMIFSAEQFLDSRNEESGEYMPAAGYMLATVGDMLLALVMGVTEVPTVQLVETAELRTMVQGLQIWPKRQQQQQQTEMMANAQMGGQTGAQQPVGHYPQTGGEASTDPYSQPIGGDRVPLQGQQPSAQERFHNLAPHFQGQQQQYGAPSAPPPVTSFQQPAYMVNP